MVDADADAPLVWVLRDNLDLTGTRFGCGIAECGVCTVQMGGASANGASADRRGRDPGLGQPAERGRHHREGAGYPPVGPAVLNAIFAAAGRRIRKWLLLTEFRV